MSTNTAFSAYPITDADCPTAGPKFGVYVGEDRGSGDMDIVWSTDLTPPDYYCERVTESAGFMVGTDWIWREDAVTVGDVESPEFGMTVYTGGGSDPHWVLVDDIELIGECPDEESLLR